MLVEQARGAVIEHFHVDADEAFELLRRWAHGTDSTILVVAETLVYAVCLDDVGRPGDRVVRDHVAAAFRAPQEHPRVPRAREGAPQGRTPPVSASGSAAPRSCRSSGCGAGSA